MWKFFIGFLLLGSFFVFNTAFSANSDVVISEIGAYATSTHEWVEIYNKGSELVDLTGWKFWENSTNHGLSVSTTDAILAPGEYAAIVQDAEQFLLDYPSFTGSIFDSSWSSLNESGEEIGLKYDSVNFIEKFVYLPAENFSLQRRDLTLNDYSAANWVEHNSGNTVGMANNFATASSTPTTIPPPTQPSSSAGQPSSQIILESPPADLTPVKINEFVADPESGNEWVELYNTGSASLDLNGALICDSRNSTSTCKKIFGTIGPNSWLVVDLQTRSFLNNSGDSLIFKDALGKIIDRVDYDDELVPDEGQSLARVADGADTDSDKDWVVTDQITAGNTNLIKEKILSPVPASNVEPAKFVSNTIKSETSSANTSAKKSAKSTAKKISSAKPYKFVNSIETARQANKGAWAAVQGVVSVLPGVFGSQYFYLTDGNAGIQIYQSKKDFPELAVGDLLKINGKVSLANGIKRINIANAEAIDILATQAMVSSTLLDLEEVDEGWGGALVKIFGEITEIKSSFMYVDDGNTEVVVYFKKGARLDKSQWREGENVEVTGVLEQAKSGWQIWPRGQSDVVSLGLSEDLLKKQALQNGGTGSSEKYLTATAGGFVTLVLGFLLRGRGAILKKAGLLAIGFIKKDKGVTRKG